GALVVGGGLLAGGDVDGAQGARNGRDGLQGASHADHLTVGDASLDPAGTVGHAREGGRVPAVLTVLPVHGEDLVMGCGAAAAGGGEAVADLHTLHGLDGHDRLGQAPVEPAIPLGVRAQSHGCSVGQDLDHTA